MCVYVQYVYTVYTKPCKVYVINTNNKKPTQVAVNITVRNKKWSSSGERDSALYVILFLN